MKKQQRSRAEYFVELAGRVKKLPVLAVIGTLVPVYTSRKQPVSKQELYEACTGQYLALCPFHADESLGSFVITPKKDMWWCFAEGLGGNGISFEMKYFDLGFKEAVFHLAKRFSILTAEEEKQYGNKKIDEDVVKHVESSFKRKQREVRTAPADVTAMVYDAIPKVCPLKEKHKKHLVKERMLEKDDLGDYFTFPTRKMDLARAVYRQIGAQEAMKVYGKKITELRDEECRALEERLSDVRENIPYVPGFFFDGMKVDFSSTRGIGFLVRDENGIPEGIQIRRDSVREGESRYVWFSSSFAAYKDGCRGGSSPGAPGGVIFPRGERKDMTPALCITEGRFKAEAIAKKGNIAVYVSGVSSWKNIIPVVENLKGNNRHVFIMFDADMMGNTAVHGQLFQMCSMLGQLGLMPVLVLWRIRDGKGFDDLVLRYGNDYAERLTYMTFPKFEGIYQKALLEVLKEMSAADIREMDAEKRGQFTKLLQSRVEKEACKE